jgi:hypothetical protein
MKKIIKGLIAMACIIGLLIPSTVSAFDVCRKECCHLYHVQKWYTVEYRDEDSNWVATNVSAWTARSAAWELGLRAGYDCFVGFNSVNQDPVEYDWKVSRFVDGVWTVETITATSRDAAAEQLGLKAGYNCWITKVF